MNRIKRHPLLETPYEPPAAERNGHAHTSGKAASKPHKRPETTGRFQTMNAFADLSARLVDTTAQACWWILFRETKSNGTATVSHEQIADRAGVARLTVTRALARLEDAKLLSVVKRGGWRNGPSTYRVHATPEK